MNVLAVCEKPGSAQPHVIQFKPPQSRDYGDPLDDEVSHNEGDIAFQDYSEILQESREEIVPAVIKVVSAGGGGANALNRMIDNQLSGVQFISINTDIQDLHNKSRADIKIQIGMMTTKGRGAGGIPEKGEKAALEDIEKVRKVLEGADMIFITAGMGGGTGTGSVPVIAKAAREIGALTVAVVTTPFAFEGRYKMKLAEEGIAKLRSEVDTLIVIPNQHLFKIIDNSTSYDNAFLLADEVLCHGVQGISEIITKTGFQNTDFADVKTIMEDKGEALMGIGFGSGEDRAMLAVKSAIDNPLLEDTSIEGATGVLINITGPKNITLVEINNIVNTVREKCDEYVHIIQGLRIDPELDDSIQVTLIATGFPVEKFTETEPAWNKKSSDSDFINYNEYVKMVERTKHPEYLPQREYQDDLDVPSIIRNYNFQAEEKKLELAEKC